MLTFWCGPNASRIETLFRQSSLAREKWAEREDYRERTIQAAIEKTTEYYIAKKRRSHSAADMPPQGSGNATSLPEIWVGARQLPDITREALAALQAANHPPELFARSGHMVAVVRDERNRHLIAEVSESALRGRMARSGFYYKLSKDGDRIECAPPLDVVKDLQALSAAEWRFPALEALVEAPCLRPDGTVCDHPGYDSSTCLYYAPAPGLLVREIPDAPMIDDVDAALELLDSAIGDFPFADDASKANALASLLTPLVRPAINSPTPLALYDAPQAGTGKTLLAEVVAMIATGRPAETFSAPADPEEWRKKITTALASGRNIVVIDNTFGNADRVMRDLANDVDLFRATIEFSLYHVGQQIKLDLWKGDIINWQFDSGAEFKVTAADGLYELNLPYPTRKVSRSCWKAFNVGACPYSTAGALDLVHFPSADTSKCDKGYDTANGCLAHGMKRYYGAVVAEPQGVTIKDNSTGVFGFGRSSITSVSLVADSIYDQVIPEIYTDSEMPVNCKVAAGRDESDFYEALGIVGEGPLIS